MISKEEFRQKCASILDENDIASFKEKRKVRKIALSVSLPIEGFIALIIAVAIHSIFSLIVLPIFLVTVVITLVIIYVSTYVNLENYKEKYVYKLLELLIDGYKYEYSHSGYIEPEVYKRSPYSAYYERYHGEDLVKINIPNDDGSPSDVVMYLSDLDLTKTEEDSDGDSHTVTVFSGCLGYIEFPFQFKCAIGINHCYANKKLTRLKTEDIAFNKNLKIYTDNELEAVVILSPKMMEKLNNFKSKSGGFSLVINNDKLFIHLYNNLFQLKSSKEGINERTFDDIYDDVYLILSIVEEIKNNNKIFKM